MATGLIAIDWDTIRSELESLYCSTGDGVLDGDGEFVPGFYWPEVRCNLRRLCLLLPEDIDIADCDILKRDWLRKLRTIVQDIWEYNNLTEAPDVLDPKQA